MITHRRSILLKIPAGTGQEVLSLLFGWMAVIPVEDPGVNVDITNWTQWVVKE